MHEPLTPGLKSRIKAKVETRLHNNASDLINEVKLTRLREQLKVGTDQIDRGEGISIESKSALDSLFDDIKA